MAPLHIKELFGNSQKVLKSYFLLRAAGSSVLPPLLFIHQTKSENTPLPATPQDEVLLYSL